MGLMITAATRSRPAPCDHWTITIVNSTTGTTVTVPELHRSTLQDLERMDEAPWWIVLALLWLRGRLAAGFTLASSVNMEIVG